MVQSVLVKSKSCWLIMYDQEKRSINLIDGSIREVGAYRVLITYHADVQEELTVNVVSDTNASAHDDDTSDVTGESAQD